MRRTILAGLLVLATLMGAATGCVPQGGGDNQPPTKAIDADGFTKWEPLSGFIEKNYGAFAVQAQIYRPRMVDGAMIFVPVGGSTSPWIMAEPASNTAQVVGGVEGQKPGPFPYQTAIAGVPFRFAIYVEPGIALEIKSEFVSLIDEGWLLKCWIVDKSGQVVPGSVDQQEAEAGGATVVNCGALVG